MKNRFWGESECIGTWLHRYQIMRMWNEGAEEVCLICKKRIFTPVRDGAVDNYEYLEHHKREVLFPGHPYFQHEYPNYGK